MVTVGSLPELHKTSPLMLGTLYHTRVLDFIVIDLKLIRIDNLVEFVVGAKGKTTKELASNEVMSANQ
jgi:hypothetical protein